MIKEDNKITIELGGLVVAILDPEVYSERLYEMIVENYKSNR